MTEHRLPWPDDHIFVVAEIGINHNGDLALVRELVQMAVDSGCDAVKFQKRTVGIVYDQATLDSPRESPFGSTTREQKFALEFEFAEYTEIDALCRETGIPWFASAWDIPAQQFLQQFDLPFNKVASALISHPEFLRTVASERKFTFISTGMSSWSDVDLAVEIFRDAGCPFMLMHSVSEYPCAEENLNLAVIQELQRRYASPCGYSGHENTVTPSVIAAALGARAIERHVTLDRTMYGTDQSASLESTELKALVSELRRLPIILGDGVKRITDGEQQVSEKLRYWLTGN